MCPERGIGNRPRRALLLFTDRTAQPPRHVGKSSLPAVTDSRAMRRRAAFVQHDSHSVQHILAKLIGQLVDAKIRVALTELCAGLEFSSIQYVGDLSTVCRKLEFDRGLSRFRRWHPMTA